MAFHPGQHFIELTHFLAALSATTVGQQRCQGHTLNLGRRLRSCRAAPRFPSSDSLSESPRGVCPIFRNIHESGRHVRHAANHEKQCEAPGRACWHQRSVMPWLRDVSDLKRHAGVLSENPSNLFRSLSVLKSQPQSHSSHR